MDYRKDRDRDDSCPKPGIGVTSVVQDKTCYIKEDSNKKENEIGSELTYLDNNIAELELSAENLEHKIEPILCIHPETCSEEKTQACRMTDLGCILQKYNRRVANVIKRIRNIHSRVEL